jgi:hypothetical protein
VTEEEEHVDGRNERGASERNASVGTKKRRPIERRRTSAPFTDPRLQLCPFMFFSVSASKLSARLVTQRWHTRADPKRSVRPPSVLSNTVLSDYA